MLATLHSWWTVLLLVVFVAIVVWAFGRGRKQDFEEAARLPLDDDGPDSRDGPRPRGNGDAHG